MIRFLPSYVGSKRLWVDKLSLLLSDKKNIIEPFAGSSVLTANYAENAILNDMDPMIHLILSRFDELIVPDVFTQDDYFHVRSLSNWWQYAYCLQKMSFSGVFRYSKNGYNVPVKKNIQQVTIRSEYEQALEKWREIQPLVTNNHYLDTPIKNDYLIILDPPYENTQAAYNKDSFDYEEYWDWVKTLQKTHDLLVFDSDINLTRQNIPITSTRKTRVNGAKNGGIEACAYYDHHTQSWKTSLYNTPTLFDYN